LKVFFTYEQQIEKLISNGLIIKDKASAINTLKFEGYYNIINGYSFIFTNQKKYNKGTTLENIRHLYEFDKNLSIIIYKYALTVECNIKALVAHEFSDKHGVDEKLYLNTSCFTQLQRCKLKVDKLIYDCNEALNEGKKYREYISHNYNKHGHVPFWVLIRALTFGTTAKFYSLMHFNERKAIAECYGISEKDLGNMLKMLVLFRNKVAHGERIFCTRLDKIMLSPNLAIIKKMSIPLNNEGNLKYGKNDFLSLMVIFKYLLPEDIFEFFLIEVKSIIEILKNNIPPDIMGKIKNEMGLIGSWKVLNKIKK